MFYEIRKYDDDYKITDILNYCAPIIRGVIEEILDTEYSLIEYKSNIGKHTYTNYRESISQKNKDVMISSIKDYLHSELPNSRGINRPFTFYLSRCGCGRFFVAGNKGMMRYKLGRYEKGRRIQYEMCGGCDEIALEGETQLDKRQQELLQKVSDYNIEHLKTFGDNLNKVLEFFESFEDFSNEGWNRFHIRLGGIFDINCTDFGNEFGGIHEEYWIQIDTEYEIIGIRFGYWGGEEGHVEPIYKMILRESMNDSLIIRKLEVLIKGLKLKEPRNLYSELTKNPYNASIEITNNYN